MIVNNSQRWIPYLQFGFKKAKHYCTYETSFTDYEEIELFELNLEENLQSLAEMLETLSKYQSLQECIQDKKYSGKGYIYFYPKSNDDKGQARLRPKVHLPFYYQVLWAAFILRIGEYFDTNENMKIVASSHDPEFRALHSWMVPWSVNNRLKRMKQPGGEKYERGFVHFNSPRLYESHQFSLRQYHHMYTQALEQLFEQNDIVYEITIDIKEFYPSVTKDIMIEAFRARYHQIQETLSKLNEEDGKIDYLQIFEKLLEGISATIDKQCAGDTFKNALQRLDKDLQEGRENQRGEGGTSEKDAFDKIEEKINDSIFLDHIGAGFLSNLVLNHTVDKELDEKLDKHTKVIRYTDDYVILSSDKEKAVKIAEELSDFITQRAKLKISESKSYLPLERIEEIEILKLKEKYQVKTAFKQLGKQIAKEKYNQQIKEITRDCSIFPAENVMDNISINADVKIHAMTEKELALYLKDLLFYFTLNEDVKGLKNETLQLFSAWRLNAVIREKNSRYDIHITDIQSILCSIEKAIKKYPYKISLYQAYANILLYLIVENNEGFEQLEHFLIHLRDLINHKKNEEEEKNNYLVFGTVVREHLLYMFHRYLNKLDVEQKKKIRFLLYRVWKVWYPGSLTVKQHISWTEQYALLRTYFMLGITLPIIPFRHMVINRLGNLHKNLNLRTRLSQSEAIYIWFLLLKSSVYRDPKGNFQFTVEERNSLEEILSYFKKADSIENIPDEEIVYQLKIYHLFLKELKKQDYSSLESNLSKKRRAINIDLKNDIQRFYYDALYESFREKNSAFIQWVENKKKNSQVHPIRALKTLKNLKKIRHFFSNTDPGYVSLPRTSKETLRVPFIDYLFYIHTLSREQHMFKLRQNLLHPPLERVIVEFLQKKLKSEQKESVNYWEVLKEEISMNNPLNMEKRIEREKLNSTEFARALFAALSLQPFHPMITKESSKYKWYSSEALYRLTNYASSEIVSYLAETLPTHNDFYKKHYNISINNTPYPQHHAIEFNQWAEQFLRQTKGYEKEHIGKRHFELRVIDIDQER